MAKMTRKNADVVLARALLFIRTQDKESGDALVAHFNEALDEATKDDLFGTEGQLDPRGDQRDES